jgi:hypothetical protein
MAFLMTDGYGADVLSGILDGLSILDPVKIWEWMSAHLPIDAIIGNCKHVSRLAILYEIAIRAGKHGMPSGEEVSNRIEKLLSELGRGESQGTERPLPRWAKCIQGEWNALQEILDLEKIAPALESELAKICAPLTINDAFDLEKAVCRSFRENSEAPLNRWEGKVRYALNIAAFEHVSKSKFFQVAARLRISNPLLPELNLRSDFDSPGLKAISSIASNDFLSLIGTADSYFLDYVEVLENPASKQLCCVEVVAVLVPSSMRRRGFFLPTLDAQFGSTELPDSSKANPHETCCSLRLEAAFFGRMTPGKPLPDFKKLVAAPEEAFFSANWRTGRRSEIRCLGQPVCEGCLLSVKRGALRLPPSLKLAWLISLNGERIAMIDEQNNRLF